MYQTEANAIGLEVHGPVCHTSPHSETDLPEAKQLRLCLLSTSGLRRKVKIKKALPLWAGWLVAKRTFSLSVYLYLIRCSVFVLPVSDYQRLARTWVGATKNEKKARRSNCPRKRILGTSSRNLFDWSK